MRYPRLFSDARGGFSLLAVPLHCHVLPTCWDRSSVGQGCSRLRLVIGVEKGNIIKQRGLRKETGYIYWVLVSGESQTWPEQDWKNEVAFTRV